MKTDAPVFAAPSAAGARRTQRPRTCSPTPISAATCAISRSVSIQQAGSLLPELQDVLPTRRLPDYGQPASTVEAIDEQQWGICVSAVNQPCHQTGVFGLDQLRALVGDDAVDRTSGYRHPSRGGRPIPFLMGQQ